jgi:hypothetical protein
MKLILIHDDIPARNQLRKMFDDLDHIVVAESDHPRQLLEDIARYQPHAIFIGQLASVFTDGTFPPIQDTVALVPVVCLPKGATNEFLISFLNDSLETVRTNHKSRSPRPYSADKERLSPTQPATHDYAGYTQTSGSVVFRLARGDSMKNKISWNHYSQRRKLLSVIVSASHAWTNG